MRAEGLEDSNEEWKGTTSQDREPRSTEILRRRSENWASQEKMKEKGSVRNLERRKIGTHLGLAKTRV